LHALYFTSLKSAKLQGANTDATPTLICVGVENLRLAHH